MFEKDGVQYYNLLRDDVIKFIPKDLPLDSVLDVGCGEGINLAYLKKYRGAKKVTGVEINEESAKKASERLDVLINRSIEDPNLKLPDHEFDLIFCLDVIEHLYDPWRVLKKLEATLKTNGIIIASIPNIQHWNVFWHLMRGKWHYQKAGFWDSTHIRFFTKSTIIEMVREA